MILSFLFELGRACDWYYLPWKESLGELPAMRILVIEDDPDAGTVLALALTELGHETVCARNFAQGSAQAESACFDALIVDRKLPGGDGRDLVAYLRARNIMTPAIFLT